MTTNLVLTIIGDDKPGLVKLLSGVVARNSGNWLESSMSQLAGKFAGILRVSVDSDKAEDLVRELERLEPDLNIVVERSEYDPSAIPVTHRPMRLSLVGNDRPGIVKDIFQALSARDVNVEELSSYCSSAPMSADTLFNAKAVLKVPAELDPELLQKELEQIADDLIVELTMDPGGSESINAG